MQQTAAVVLPQLVIPGRDVTQASFASPGSVDRSRECGGCHGGIYKQWNSSVHALASFSNPVYRASIDRFRRARVSTLIYSSLGVSFFAYLPMVLTIALEDEAIVWRSTSAIYGFWQFLALAAHVRSYPTFRTQPDFSVGAVGLAALAFALSVTLNAYNVIAVAESWPFLASLACALVVAGSRFAQLVDSLWKDDPAR